MLAENYADPLPVPDSSPESCFNIVVAGEFNAGKSSVLNLLFRKATLPATLDISALPPLRILPSSRSVDGGLAKSNLFACSAGHGPMPTEIEVPLTGFQGAAFYEVSVGQNGNLAADAAMVLAQADLLIWCTMGQRAWCLSEIDIIEQLPKPLLETAILAVTRSDYLRHSSDMEKVKQRLKREAGPYFKSIHMLDCGRKSVAAAPDPAKWAVAGGQALMREIAGRFETSEYYRKVEEVAAPIVPTSHSLSLYEAWDSEIEAMQKWVENQPRMAPSLFVAHVNDRISTFIGTALSIGRADSKHLAAIKVFEAAHGYLCQIESEKTSEEQALAAADLAVQLLHEFNVKKQIVENKGL